jgi:cyclase
MPDLDGVTIKTYHVNGPVYMLEATGDVAGNIAVSSGPDGFFIVDTQFSPLSGQIKDALSKLNNGKVHYVVNTHYHDDHSHGNEAFSASAAVIAHSNTRELQSDRQDEGRPVITFEDSVSIHFNGEEIKLIHFPKAHTGTDVAVFFTKSNIVHLGDLLNSGISSYPNVDLNSGGSLKGLLRAIKKLIKIIPDDAYIIPGHYDLTDRDGLKVTYDMLVETIGIVRSKKNDGLSLEQIKKEGFPEKYDDWGTAFTNAEAWIENIYRGL